VTENGELSFSISEYAAASQQIDRAVRRDLLAENAARLELGIED
jgi:ribosomal protein S20